jgi:hypothetical protein
MDVAVRTTWLGCFRLRLLALLCVALTLSFNVSITVSASESAHHELEVVQAGSTANVVYCSGDDQSCGISDHDHGRISPHLHTTEIGLIGLPAVGGPSVELHFVATGVVSAQPLPIDGLEQQAPDRPPRTSRI